MSQTFEIGDELVDGLGRKWTQTRTQIKIEDPDGRVTFVGRDGKVGTLAPQYAKGNLAAVKHGAYAHEYSIDGQLLSERMVQICEALINDPDLPWIAQSDGDAIQKYCRCEARVRLLDDHLWEAVNTNRKTKYGVGLESLPPYILSELGKHERNAMDAAKELGLSPASRMKLMKDAGVAFHFGPDRLKDLSDVGGAIRDRRLQEALG